jgi:glycerol-3-phosphate responsive antiterminator
LSNVGFLYTLEVTQSTMIYCVLLMKEKTMISTKIKHYICSTKNELITLEWLRLLIVDLLAIVTSSVFNRIYCL